MVIVRQRDANLVPKVWQMSHMVAHALTAAVSMASGVMFYLAIAKSNYHCYPYNEVVIVQDFTREINQTFLIDEQIWYWNTNCYVPFKFSLELFMSSVVWTSFFLVFGRGGSSVSEESDQSKYFRSVVVHLLLCKRELVTNRPDLTMLFCMRFKWFNIRNCVVVRFWNNLLSNSREKHMLFKLWLFVSFSVYWHYYCKLWDFFISLHTRSCKCATFHSSIWKIKF